MTEIIIAKIQNQKMAKVPLKALKLNPVQKGQADLVRYSNLKKQESAKSQDLKMQKQSKSQGK